MVIENTNTKPNTVFFGSPELAVDTLEELKKATVHTMNKALSPVSIRL